jgi:methyl-accepting chemotaxis protein
MRFRTLRLASRCGWLITVVAVGGCVSSPPQTIELADVVAEQSAALERSHRDVVRAYFDQLEASIDDFIDNQWIPDFLSRAVASEQVQNELEAVQAGLAIDPEHLRAAVHESLEFSLVEADLIVRALEDAQFDYRVQFGEIMIAFSEAALREINKTREELKKPLRQNLREMMAALDEGYSNLHQGQAVVRAYLASVANLVQEQDEILMKLNLIEQRNAAMDGILSASETAADAAERVDDAAEVVAEASEQINDFLSDDN